MAEAIRVEGVSKRFGAVVALDRVSFAVEAGELFFLLGPSGCGKTTMLRILAGLETPDEGRLFLRGVEVTGLPPHRRGAPLVFQNYALWPHLTVAANVGFGLVEQGVGKAEIEERTAEALQAVALDGLGGRTPAQLSGGQQQRVVLARALVLRPAVVLLDEPLSNLDARLRTEMRAEIERLHAETGVTFLFVTHDQSEAISLADRIAIMDAGRIRALGSPRELWTRPTDLFAAAFLGEANRLDGVVREIAVGFAQVETPLGLWRCLAGPGLAVGARAACLFRPEAVEPVAGGNGFEAVVERRRMHGEVVRLRLAAGELRLSATVLNRPEADPPDQGRWHVPPEAVTALPEA